MENQWIIWAWIIILIYFLPTLVAGSRWSINTILIFFLNLFLAWLIIPWFLLFFMAVWKTKKDAAREEEMIQLLKNKNT